MSMPKSPDDKCFTYIPFEKALTPPAGIIRHYKEQWFAVHPERGFIVFQKHALQTNKNEDVVRHLIPSLYPWAEARYYASVFIPIDPQDYCY